VSATEDRKLALSQAIETAQACYPLLTELWAQSAREYRTKFESYIAAGFNPDQAMQMICAELSKR
jgi:hypothetical protein